MALWTLVGRQGDIYVYRYSRELPDGPFKRTARILVAQGEKTGHQHILEGRDLQVMQVAQQPTGLEGVALLFARVGEVALLKHDEHTDVQMKPGTYAFLRQREADWELDEPKPVID